MSLEAHIGLLISKEGIVIMFTKRSQGILFPIFLLLDILPPFVLKSAFPVNFITDETRSGIPFHG